VNDRQVDLSVIIVNWNTRDLLAQCLKSVYETDGDLSLEAIAVDNGSADGSAEMMQRDFPQTHVIANTENVGFVRANNQALAVSEGRYVLLLNSDAALVPGALSCMVQFMDAHPGVGIVGPKVLNPDGSFQSSYMDFPNLLSEFMLMIKLSKVFYGRYFPSHSPRQSRETKEVDWMLGACMMMRRDTLDEIGGLDETFFMYSEEVDWCWRTKQAGWAVYYLPEATVLHWGGQSSSKVPIKRRALVYKSKLLFLDKHYGAMTASLFKGALLTTSLLKMGLWSALFLSPRAQDHSRAAENVRSYKVLIRDLVSSHKEGRLA
jgi:hypothetical protein